MSDFKSMFPDFKELSSMFSKLFQGIKRSVEEIAEDYKQKRAASEPRKPAPRETRSSQSSESTKKTKTTSSGKKIERLNVAFH